ncbi:cupin domain-containing protein [Paenibacillus sp.]|uniref:cupin domain-containing protein n=1 Tax=Paenibacillus sp. TaxID=58172 RepID=UPI002811AC18|nr:cupin domain-containing protein [Paenibacillus sp.]
MNQHAMPRTIENPLVRDRVTFLTTAAESGGSYEYVKVELAPGGGNGLHYHQTYSEHFEAVEGELHLEVDGLLRSLRPGETVSAPPGTKHRFFNPGPDPIVFYTKIEPARRFEPMLRIAYGLARDGRVHPKSGIPRNALEMAVLFVLGESFISGIPIWLQKAIFGSLYAIAKRLGVEERLLRTYCR